jgi:hypothetical protein
LQVTVSGSVHLKDKCREEHVHTKAEHADETTSPLALVRL